MNEEELLKVLNKEKSYTEEDLLLFIYDLRKENARLKDKIEKSFKIVDNKLTNLNLEYGINNEFREEYDELWEILKEN